MALLGSQTSSDSHKWDNSHNMPWLRGYDAEHSST